MNSCCNTITGSNDAATRKEINATRTVRPERVFQPAVDIVESADRFTLTADVPGADSRSVEAHFEDGVLTLRAGVGPRQPEGTRWLVREYGVGGWERTFRIGEGIDAERIEAICRDGVLTLTLPKAESARPRKIEVRGS